MVSGNGSCASTARLLVLGDKQVGKSAAIVRYTTGRYIQEYGRRTGHWLYKHRLAGGAHRRAQSVELLEQGDLRIFDSSNLFASNDQAPANQSLASRVAMDQQLASELQEKQELMSKLRWANAYVVIYAINEVSSFNKAIKYLNLIANSINTAPSRCSTSSASSASSSSTSSTTTTTTTSSCSSSSAAPACDHNQLDRLQLIQLRSSAQETAAAAAAAANHSQAHAEPQLDLLVAQTTATCAQPGAHRRPILLLGNKRDLERQGRQVSASDGRLLAMRHQSMFAEVSIAETHKLIDLHLTTLIDHIDAANLHAEHLRQQRPIQAEINHWRPSIEMALVQTNVSVTAPIWASLIKSTRPAPAPANPARIVKSCALGGQVAQSAQVSQVAARGAKSAQSLSAHQGPSHRYETLKSSFKRASMAIVSSKALAMGHSSRPPEPPKRPSITSQSDRDSILADLSNLGQCETVGEHRAISGGGGGHHHLGWFKSHLGRGGRPPEVATSKTSSVCSLEGASVKAAGSQLSLANNEGEAREKSGGRRLLFRYRNRRKTVAFNPIEALADTNSLKSLGTPNELANLELGKTVAKSILLREQRQNDYNSTRCSSNRSSSSLSTTTGPNEAACPFGSRSNPTTNSSSSRPAARRGSSSRASTPDASYEDSGDELMYQPRGNFNSSSLSSSSSSSSPSAMIATATVVAAAPKEPVKRRYQLVKSVQTTLANMSSRSSNVASAATKRSFCNSLFKHQPTIEAKRVGDAAPPVLVAKTEHIRTRPTTVGYCK